MLRRVFLLLFSVWVCLPVRGVVAAPSRPAPLPQDTRSAVVTFKDMGYADDKAIGALSGLTYNLTIPSVWQRPGKLYLNLVISHSNLLLAERSVATVVFNDLPVASFPLDDTNQDHAAIQVELPLGSDPRPRTYKLSVVFYMRVNREQCLDLQSPALWSIVHETSSIEFRYPEGEERFDLALYPYPLFPSPAVVPESVHFVLPANPTDIDLSAAAQVSAKMGQLAASNLLSFSSGTPEDAPPGSSLVVIGQPSTQGVLHSIADYLPLSLSPDGQGFVYPNGEPIPPDWGVIQIIPNPWNTETALLVVSGGSPIGLQRAGEALASQATIDLFKGAYAVIPDVPPANQTLYPMPGEPRENITLAELTGHQEDWEVRGIVIQSLSFNFFLPNEWTMQNSGYVDLHWAHAPTVWSERSMLEVYLNGRLLHVELLTPENALPNTLRVGLPAKLLRPGHNYISTRFTLRLQLEPCVHEFGEEAWATVFSDSMLFLPHQIARQAIFPDLETYPYPFYGQPGLDDVTLAVPDGFTPDELTVALKISARLGKSARGKALRPHMVTASQIPPVEGRAPWHWIVIGEGMRIPMWNEIQPRLKVSGQTLKELMAPTGETAALERDSAPVGVIQELVSPWDETRALLVVTGNTRQALALAGDALSFGETSDELRGDVVTLTEGPLEGGLITVFTTLPTPTPIVNATPMDESTVPTSAPLKWFFLGLAIVLVVIFALLFVGERLGRARERRKMRTSNLPPEETR